MWTQRTANLSGNDLSPNESTFSVIKNHYRKFKKSQTDALPSDISTHIFESVETLPEFWDTLLPETHPLRKLNLSILEKAGLKDIFFRYVIIYKNREVIGLITVQLLNFNHKHLGNLGMNQGISRMFLKCHHLTLLVCGNLFAQNQQGFYLMNPSGQIFLLPVLNELAKKINACGILIKDCQEPLMESVIRYSRFDSWEKDIGMELYIDPEWRNFDGYLNNLGRKYLQRAKKIIAAGANVERLILDEKQISKWENRIEELYNQVALKQPVRLGLLNGAYFRLMQQQLADQFSMTGYFLSGELIAFRTTIIKENSEEIHYIGFDQELNKSKSLYFNMLFDALIAALDRKALKLELGRTALDAKASLGAKPVAIRNYIQIRNPLAAWVFKSISGKFENEIGDNWQNRNPFRNL